MKKELKVFCLFSLVVILLTITVVVFFNKDDLISKDNNNDILTEETVSLLMIEPDFLNPLVSKNKYVQEISNLVFETDFVSGTMNSTPDCVSPAGVFDITYKTTNATLRGGDYEQFVYYWMPFFGNYGMHDATWRWQFGGNIFMTDGSHGCLNLPLDAAATIYSYMYEGYPVICYYY